MPTEAGAAGRAGDEMVCIHRGTDPIEASLLQGMLQNQGIPATVQGADLVGGYSGIPKVCDVRLLVPARHRADGLQALARYERERPDATEWRCEGCGEVNAGTFECCWACGKGKGPVS